MFIDTHTHLYVEEFDQDRSALINKAIHNGVKKFFLPNIDASSIENMHQLEQDWSQNCFAMMGLHPCSVKENYKEELDLVKKWLGERKYIAVGEIGLDLYWDKTFYEEQKIAFQQQIDWALEYDYPISIHCRDAFDPIFDILSSYKRLPKAVFHCFSGNLEQANKILALGNFKLGIGGVLTFKNSGLDKVIEQIDLQHLVLETDAPYLAPVPYRGKRNEPVYLLEIAKKLAELKGTTLQEVERLTCQNADFIFKS